MKLVRFIYKNNAFYGNLDGQKISVLSKNFPVNNEIIDEIMLNSVSVLPVCQPSKIICAALNFPGTSDFDPKMSEPLFFIKAPNSIVGNYAQIRKPIPKRKWWGESELAIVIKKSGKNIAKNEINDYVLGVTIANDVTMENIENRDHHLLSSKGFDEFCPIGPIIETQFQDRDWEIEAYQNNNLIRKGNSKNHFWSWEKIIYEISKYVTLNPFDLILTGNPPRTSETKYLEHNSIFSAKIEGIGVLTTTFFDY